MIDAAVDGAALGIIGGAVGRQSDKSEKKIVGFANTERSGDSFENAIEATAEMVTQNMGTFGATTGGALSSAASSTRDTECAMSNEEGGC